MNRKEYGINALTTFNKQYPSCTSSDLQAFILGFQAAEEICLKQDNKKWVIKDLDEKMFISIYDRHGNFILSEIFDATKYNSLEEATEYRNNYPNNNWGIKELYFKTISI